MRVRIFESLYKSVKENKIEKSINELENMLSDEFLKELVKTSGKKGKL